MEMKCTRDNAPETSSTVSHACLGWGTESIIAFSITALALKQNSVTILKDNKSAQATLYQR